MVMTVFFVFSPNSCFSIQKPHCWVQLPADFRHMVHQNFTRARAMLEPALVRPVADGNHPHLIQLVWWKIHRWLLADAMDQQILCNKVNSKAQLWWCTDWTMTHQTLTNYSIWSVCMETLHEYVSLALIEFVRMRFDFMLSLLSHWRQIKFLKTKEGTAMVQMGDGVAVERCVQHLNNIPIGSMGKLQIA